MNSNNGEPELPLPATTEEARSELASLGAEILFHDKKYHQDDAPEITDMEYDAMRRRYAQVLAKFPTAADPSPAKDDASPRRIKSTVTFPYVALNDAAVLAKLLHDAGSVPMTRDQVAHCIGADPENGSFSVRLSAARMFGVIDSADGKIELTSLGHAMSSSDPSKVRAALRDAFLNVELYRRMVEHFRGKILPPRAGIESALAMFGVSPKQTDKSRQAFEKSALFAGFLNSSKDRLVEPIIRDATPTSEEPQQVPTPQSLDLRGWIAPKSDAVTDPLIHGMLIRLPKPGAVWSHEKRALWLRTLASNFDIVYATDDASDGSTIEIKAHSVLSK